jgi:hypothetical protein
MWTGDGHMITDRDGLCVCGEPLIEEVSDGYEYRVEFESVKPLQAAEMVAHHGKDIWSRLSPAEWDALQWVSVTSNGRRSVIESQYRNLLEWASSHAQPVRNVRLLKRKDTAWEDQPQ